jgi:exonuclease III
MSNITIIQYNCGNSNNQLSKPFFDSVSQTKHQILAIQEPVHNRATNRTYCPPGYTLLYEGKPETKICFMISKRLDPSRWRHELYGPHVAALHISPEDPNQTSFTIINVYNPRDTVSQTISTRNAITEACRQNKGELLLLGDFNIHHPKWGGPRTATEPQANSLLRITGKHNLRLITPPGIYTWKRGAHESVIDLTFASPAIRDRLIFCGTVNRWAITQDHIPIRIQIDLNMQSPATSKRFALKKLNGPALIADVERSAWHASADPLTALQTAIQEGLNKHCPRARPSPQARRNWSPRAAELLAGARQAKRRYSATHQPEDN